MIGPQTLWLKQLPQIINYVKNEKKYVEILFTENVKSEKDNDFFNNHNIEFLKMNNSTDQIVYKVGFNNWTLEQLDCEGFELSFVFIDSYEEEQWVTVNSNNILTITNADMNKFIDSIVGDFKEEFIIPENHPFKTISGKRILNVKS
jgi:hypothetical protein